MNNELQELAEELATLDPEKDKARVADIKARICEIEIGFIKVNKDGTVYFPLLTQNNNRIKKDEFWNIFCDGLLNLLQKYDPEKGPFYTAFKYIINKRAIDWFRKNTKDGNIIVSIEAQRDSLGKVAEVADTRSEDIFAAIEKWSYFGELLEEYVQLLKDKDGAKDDTGIEYLHVMGFFTFDTTKAVKDDEELAEVACQYDVILFRFMVINLLCFLMEGVFYGMVDVEKNPLRSGINLNQRGKMLERYYKVSHPTLNKYSQLYDGLRETIYGAVGEKKYHSF